MLLKPTHTPGVCMHAASRMQRARPPATAQLRSSPAGCGAAAAAATAARHATRRHHHQGSGIITARRSRQRAVTALAAAHNGHSASNDEEPLYLPATASTYVPFSAQLMLAMARQGHLDRYREELAAAYEPGAPVELTRCCLLISNIAQPQMDHRPSYAALEQMLAAAALLLMHKLGRGGDIGSFGGLDLASPEHVVRAAQAICEVLFEQEGLHINVADPHAPENGSLADVMSTGRGNPWSLAVAFLHLADGMGLPCALVQSATQGLLVRVGQHSSSSSSPAVFLVSMSQPGVIFAHPAGPHLAAAADPLQPAASLAASSGDQEGGTSEPLDAATSDFSASLNQFLRIHREYQQPRAAPTDDGDGGEASTPGTNDGSAVGAEGRHVKFSTGDVRDGATGPDSSSSSWQEVDSHAAQDAATRNGWKLLFGPGALEEWGGSVRSSASSGQLSVDPSGDSSSSSGWLPESPFAAAAQQPFPEGVGGGGGTGGPAETEALLSRAASLDTCCGSSMELDGDDGEGHDSSSLECSAAPPMPPGVLPLAWTDVGAGGLQPVSTRAVLQQLLTNMKLSLMMSGRDEELLLVLRYLRATDPFSLPDLRDMALALATDRPEEAAPLLREYLAVAPGAPDADMVAEVLEQVLLRVRLGRSRGWDAPRQ